MNDSLLSRKSLIYLWVWQFIRQKFQLPVQGLRLRKADCCSGAYFFLYTETFTCCLLLEQNIMIVRKDAKDWASCPKTSQINSLTVILCHVGKSRYRERRRLISVFSCFTMIHHSKSGTLLMHHRSSIWLIIKRTVHSIITSDCITGFTDDCLQLLCVFLKFQVLWII